MNNPFKILAIVALATVVGAAYISNTLAAIWAFNTFVCCIAYIRKK